MAQPWLAKPWLSMTKYTARGPQKLKGTTDVFDGFGAEFKPHGLPGTTYTIMQQIRRNVEWKPDTAQTPSPDFDEFTECWPSKGKSKHILDKFMISRRYTRHKTVGAMTVLAVAWITPGNRHDLAAMGFAEGQDGGVNTPWGETWGQHGFVAPPLGTKLLVRHFKVEWDNRNKNYEDQYHKAEDLKPGLEWHNVEQVVSGIAIGAQVQPVTGAQPPQGSNYFLMRK